MSAALLVPVFLASVMGSVHCVGMCGPMITFYSAGDTSGGVGRARALLPHAAYHLGRLVTYVLLGGAAGALGAAVDLAGSAGGITRVASVVAGVVMLVWGIGLLADALGVGLPKVLGHPRMPRVLQLFGSRVMLSAKGRPPVVRAGLIGLASTFLPCGWLYAFALTAAGTGTPWTGALVMAAFWAGSVPLLLGLGIGLQSAGRVFRKHVPVLSSVVLIVIGLTALFGRSSIPAFDGRIAPQGQTPSPAPHCDCHPK
jgi:sulfite exporter TauE/SafE